MIDLNCDMGEGMGNDEQIMPYISSASIACGYHAGDESSIWKTVRLAIEHNVSIGAHVSYLDKKNFGRIEVNMPAAEVYELITQQLIILNEITGFLGAVLHHVKPHGALYNMSAKDPALAKVIASAVKDFDKDLLLFGLSGSHSISEAEAAGLKAVNEVFADRSYRNDGTLTPRSLQGALISDKEASLKQVMQLINEQQVTTLQGMTIAMKADTICIHSDSIDAAGSVKAIHDAIIKKGILIKSPVPNG
jgi:UPF0271 protein